MTSKLWERIEYPPAVPGERAPVHVENTPGPAPRPPRRRRRVRPTGWAEAAGWLLVLAGLVLAGFAVGRWTAPGPERVEVPSVDTWTPSTQPGDGPEAAVKVDVESAARRFVAAWQAAGTVEERSAAMRPVASDRVVAQVAGLPADQRPQGRFLERPVVSVAGTSAFVVCQTADGNTVRLQLLQTSGGLWTVVDVS